MRSGAARGKKKSFSELFAGMDLSQEPVGPAAPERSRRDEELVREGDAIVSNAVKHFMAGAVSGMAGPSKSREDGPDY